jgi:allantoinase
MNYDLVVKNVRVVRPNVREVVQGDVAIIGGKFAAVGPQLQGKQTYDGKGLLAFPGVVDAHMHTGIYSPLAEDAVSESRAAAQGGVTTSLNYFRSGQYYLNKGGPYAEFFPEVLKISEGKFHVDYGFHLAPMDSAKSRCWWRSSACPPTRFSCSTARTACTAAPTASATS